MNREDSRINGFREASLRKEDGNEAGLRKEDGSETSLRKEDGRETVLRKEDGRETVLRKEDGSETGLRKDEDRKARLREAYHRKNNDQKAVFVEDSLREKGFGEAGSRDEAGRESGLRNEAGRENPPQMNWSWRIWEIVYPLGIYYSAVVISMMVFGRLLGTEEKSYMIRQILTGVVVIPIVYSWYRADQKRFCGRISGDAGRKAVIRDVLFTVAVALCLSVGLNNLILMSPLAGVSGGFAEANRNFYGSTLAIELIGASAIAPLQEELLFRGVIHGRLRKLFHNPAKAVLLSALIFGLMHFNVVQFVYAGLFGIALALLYDRAAQIWAPVLAHLTANTFAVLRTELQLFGNTADGTTAAWLFSAALLVVGILLLWVHCKKRL